MFLLLNFSARQLRRNAAVAICIAKVALRLAICMAVLVRRLGGAVVVCVLDILIGEAG